MKYAQVIFGTWFYVISFDFDFRKPLNVSAVSCFDLVGILCFKHFATNQQNFWMHKYRAKSPAITLDLMFSTDAIIATLEEELPRA